MQILIVQIKDERFPSIWHWLEAHTEFILTGWCADAVSFRCIPKDNTVPPEGYIYYGEDQKGKKRVRPTLRR